MNFSKTPPKTLSLALMGSPLFAAELFEYITARRQFGEVALEVKAVWTNPPRPIGRGLKLMKSPVEEWAERRGISCYTPEKLGESDVVALRKEEVDLILVVAYGKILPKIMLEKSALERLSMKPFLGIYNLHFSLLPQYRGASPLQSAILAGDEVGGITFQTIAEKMDSGDIVTQKEFVITDLTTEEYLQKSTEVAKEELSSFIGRVVAVKLAETKLRDGFSPQATQVNQFRKVSYCKKIKKSDGEITRRDTLKKIYQKYLAFKIWPTLQFYCEGVSYQITELSKVSLEEKETLVSLIEVDGLSIVCERINSRLKRLFFVEKKMDDGVESIFLEIIKIKKKGKKALPAHEFINGCGWVFPVKLF